MDLLIKDKIIIVTGGAKGIGEGIVKSLSEEGAIPVIIGRNTEDNQKALASVAPNGFQVTAELSVPDECRKAIDTVLKTIRSNRRSR